jgi:hypothetical protein
MADVAPSRLLKLRPQTLAGAARDQEYGEIECSGLPVKISASSALPHRATVGVERVGSCRRV